MIEKQSYQTEEYVNDLFELDIRVTDQQHGNDDSQSFLPLPPEVTILAVPSSAKCV